ncbi:hypothetical protein [Kitasatospora sp. MAP5-34]|uniref:hypothetical protein n=1 Tax=Kitasatospora sp. MAP5-34 TaxID=3035102 RepID=UPI002475F856|nr:hypothetical protein [Kitasatospora sp. MAP5-34]MDH6574459.1 hypothetical protein [Kitasatospora sp. MAP5-34]
MVAIVTSWLPRMLRAAVFAALCVALAATAHVTMSDAGLPAYVLVAASAGTVGATWLLADRRRGLAVVGGWMVAVQAALHLFFEAAAPMGGPAGRLGYSALDLVNHLLLCGPGQASTGMAPDEVAPAAGLNADVLSVSVVDSTPDMQGLSGMPDMTTMPGMPGMTRAGSMGLTHGMSVGMLFAHLLAALACALLLWRGEAAVAGLFELLCAAAGAVVPVLLLFVPCRREPTPRCRPAAHRRARLPRPVLLLHTLVRRGPPSVFAV